MYSFSLCLAAAFLLQYIEISQCTYNTVVGSTTVNDSWHLNPTSQQSFDLVFSLKKSWTFDEWQPSQLSFEFDGFTPNQTRADGEFIIVFSVNNQQYFSVVIPMDTNLDTWKYYPADMFQTAENVYNDIIIGSESQTRWQRTSNNANWSNISSDYRNALEWPFTITLNNNPWNHTFQYQCILSDATLQFEYASEMLANLPIDVYILNNASNGSSFDIYSVRVTKWTDAVEPMDIVSTTSWLWSSTQDMMSTLIFDETLSDDTATTLYGTDTIFNGTLQDPETPRDETFTLALPAVIGIVVGCVCAMVLAISIALYCVARKRQKRINDPKGINKGEYYRPTIVSTQLSIEDVLDQKRKENDQVVNDSWHGVTESCVFNNNVASEDEGTVRCE